MTLATNQAAINSVSSPPLSLATSRSPDGRRSTAAACSGAVAASSVAVPRCRSSAATVGCGVSTLAAPAGLAETVAGDGEAPLSDVAGAPAIAAIPAAATGCGAGAPAGPAVCDATSTAAAVDIGESPLLGTASVTVGAVAVDPASAAATSGSTDAAADADGATGAGRATAIGGSCVATAAPHRGHT